MIKDWFKLGLGWLLWCLVAKSSLAEFVITIPDQTLMAGEQGSIDVYIHSTADEAVQFANYTFRIDSIAIGAPGTLEFTGSQSSSEQTSTSPPYFLGSDIDAANFSAVVQQDTPTQITGFDSTKSGNDVTLTTADRLLARLEVQHIGSGLSGTFRISLVQNPLLTFFLDAAGDPISISNDSFTSFGRISVGPPSAVPEPACLLIGSLGGVVALRTISGRAGRKHRSPTR